MSRARNVANPTQITIPVSVSANLSTNAAISIGNTTVNTAITSSSLTTTSNTVTIGTAAYFVANGNVGIGTSSPSQKLHLAGGSYRYMRVDVGTTAAGLVGGESNLFILGYNTVPSLNNVLDSSLGTGRLDFGNSSGGYIAFLTGTTNTAPSERMRIDSGGKVLIGATSASAANELLAVRGASPMVNIRASSGSPALRFYDSNDTGSTSCQINYYVGTSFSLEAIPSIPMVFLTNNTERMRIDSGGNVGIGATNPDIFSFGSTYRILTVQNTATNGNACHFIAANGTGDSFIQFTNQTYRRAGINADSSSNLTFATNGSNSSATGITERMRITSSGNVGIGTTGPGARFHALNQIYITGRNLIGWIGGAGSWNQNGYEELGIGWNGIRSIYTGGDDWALAFSTGTSGQFAAGTQPERVRITGGGDFCVATTSSSVSGLTSAFITTDLSNAAKHGLNINSLAEGYSAIGIRKHNTSGTSYPMYIINSSGSNVGSISMTNSAVAFNTSSDYRLKENIVPMTGALTKVAQLKPVTFNWKDGGSAGQGFIAHELQEVCPEAVTGEKDASKTQQVEVSPAIPATYDENGNELTPAIEAVYEERKVPVYQGVDTSYLVATLTAAIKELKAITDAQATRIEALEAKVNALENN